MSSLHAVGGWGVLAGAALLTVVCAAAALLDRPGPWVEWLQLAVLAVVAIEALAGAALWLSGARPERRPASRRWRP